MHLRSLIGAAAAALLTVGSAHATTLTGHLTADDAYSVYLSSSANTLGTLVSSASGWSDAETFSTSLSGGTQYLQIVVTNGQVWGGLLGDFSLSDSGYVFANGGSSLFTGLSNWTMTDANGVVRTITSAGAAPSRVPSTPTGSLSKSAKASSAACRARASGMRPATVAGATCAATCSAP